MKLPLGENRNLVLVRAGARSLHPGWMAADPADQTFDLIVLAYAPTVLAPERDDFGHIDIPGFKVAGYGAFLRAHRDILERYDQVALIDDDIDTDAGAIARAFDLGRAHDLELWQPSLSWASHFSYAALLTLPGAAPVRPINFVEMMCPFFRTAALLEIADLFSSGAETAIDIGWSCILGRRPGALAVLNAVSVTHTRPVGQLAAMNGFEDTGAGYADEIGRLLAEFDVASFPGAIPLGSPPLVRPSPWTRLRLALSMSVIIAGLVGTPMPWRRFLRVLVIDTLRILVRDPRIPGDPVRILERARQLAAARQAG